MSSTKIKNQLNQIVIVSITVTIMLFTLTFIVWTYQTNKQESTIQLTKKIKEIRLTTLGLAKVKRLKLNAFAQNITNGSMLKAALSTKHQATIIDALDELKDKNNLDFILVINQKKITYANSEVLNNELALKEVTAGNFIGVSKTDRFTLIIGKNPSIEEINSWSEITGSYFVLENKKQKTIVSNYDKKSKLINLKKNEINITPDNNYVIDRQKLLKDTLTISHYYPLKESKKMFLRKRNKLIVFGLSLTFIGLIFSLIVSRIIMKVLSNKRLSNDSSQFEEILEEVRFLKKKLL